MVEKITLTSIAQRNHNIVEASIDGETVMMSIENGQYYGLDSIASRIWALLEKPEKVEDICLQLLESYDVSKEQCETEVLQFLDTLKDNNIIEVST